MGDGRHQLRSRGMEKLIHVYLDTAAADACCLCRDNVTNTIAICRAEQEDRNKTSLHRLSGLYVLA